MAGSCLIEDSLWTPRTKEIPVSVTFFDDRGSLLLQGFLCVRTKKIPFTVSVLHDWWPLFWWGFLLSCPQMFSLFSFCPWWRRSADLERPSGLLVPSRFTFLFLPLMAGLHLLAKDFWMPGAKQILWLSSRQGSTYLKRLSWGQGARIPLSISVLDGRVHLSPRLSGHLQNPFYVSDLDGEVHLPSDAFWACSSKQFFLPVLIIDVGVCLLAKAFWAPNAKLIRFPIVSLSFMSMVCLPGIAFWVLGVKQIPFCFFDG